MHSLGFRSDQASILVYSGECMYYNMHLSVPNAVGNNMFVYYRST